MSKGPLRVAVVARSVMPLHGYGGLERSVHDLVRHLAARGVEVTLISPPPRAIRRAGGDDPFASPKITCRHVEYATFPFANRRGTTVLDRSSAYPVFGLRAGRLAASLVRNGEVDIVHGFGASVLGYARERRRAAAPLVFNPQGLEEFGATATRPSRLKHAGYWPLRRAVRTCGRAADRIIATDHSLVPTVERHLAPRPDQLVTIPNGIDLVAVSGMAGPADGRLIRERYGIGSGETLLLSVGRIEHNKGFDVLAAALAGAERHIPALATGGWRWTIVGTGPYRRELERVIAHSGLSSHVILAGRATEADLHAWYEAATIFVHPTRYEGSSLVTLEAMAHRKPIVATRAGGLPDKVTPGVNGWLVEPDDADALARALQDAASDPIRLLAMGAASRERVEREFAWSVLVDQYVEMYDELLLRRPVSRRKHLNA
jgi:glycosyltransferase involved in cell wall biosynthesis